MAVHLLFEKSLWKNNLKNVAGIDEVGRGSFAGPVVAAAVVFSNKIKVPREVVINDSKLLSPKRRSEASIWIKENSLFWGVGVATVTQINKFGIKKATEIAFRQAVSKIKADFLLIDAFYVPYVRGLRKKKQKAIVKGDTKSFTIASASIIAKVYRDEIMVNLSRRGDYKEYGWERNKGYGTKEHREAIKKHGITRHHRTAFVD